ncbi:MAG: DUF393 domain-containing protein [Thaumarchaeota archaeon]|nr:DUF393 domain-containing protein [Nitrososphaerota archaeon]
MYTLVYDADCGPCTRFRKAVGFLDARDRIRFVGLNEADSSGLLEGLHPALRHRSFHLIGPSGKIWSGAEALPPLAALLPGGSPFAIVLGSSPIAFKSAAFVYSVFSRLHDTGSCSYAPGGSGGKGDRISGGPHRFLGTLN